MGRHGRRLAIKAATCADDLSAPAVFRARAEHSRVQPRLPADLLARAWVGEQLAVLHWWLEHDTPPMPAEEATRMLLDLAVHGRFWASGFTAPS